jgi:hypothetical protein
MRRGRREKDSNGNGREGFASLASPEMEFCLFGQMVEWSFGYVDDRSGSKKLSE